MKDMPEKKNHSESEPLQGVVIARKCDCCGHHELGLTCDTGEYVALKPGMRVLVLAAHPEEP